MAAMKKSMATAQMKITRIAFFLVLLALAAAMSIDRATRENFRVYETTGLLLLLGFIRWYHSSRVHLHVYIDRRPAAERHQFRTCGETTGQTKTGIYKYIYIFPQLVFTDEPGVVTDGPIKALFLKTTQKFFKILRHIESCDT
jgi:hypothetical protein